MGSEILKLLLLLVQVMLLLIQTAESSSIVKYLPGFEGPLPFELETGYIGIGEAEDEQMFYYFIKSDSNPEKDPLLIWLTGGPDCSSFSGLVCENGPLAFKMEAFNGSLPTLVATTYSWTKVANIIYLDQPVGTGFSYSRNPFAGIISDTGMVKRVDEFVRKWLDKHPEYFSNPFYVTGNSYSGKVIPAIVQEISHGNSIYRKPQINLQGYVLGNPVTNYDLDKNFRIQFAHNMGLISEELYESMKIICGGSYVNIDPLNTECLKLVEEYAECVSRINEDLILIPICEKTSPDCFTYAHLLSEYWTNDQSVRKALKVVDVYDKLKIDDQDMMVVPSIATQDLVGSLNHSKIEKLRPWSRCSGLPHHKDIKSSIPHHKNNSIKGYRSLILSGDHDMVIPSLATQAWIKSLNYSITEKWRPWMIDNQVAGYTRTYANNMTFATIKGGGHTLDFKPEESSTAFQRWIRNQPL